MIAINLHEWIKIGLLKQIDDYPFGGEGPVPYYYKSAGLYSLIALIWSLLFIANLIIGIVSILKNKITRTYMTFWILILLIVAQYIHGLID
jgi:hypothetical protein